MLQDRTNQFNRQTGHLAPPPELKPFSPSSGYAATALVLLRICCEHRFYLPTHNLSFDLPWLSPVYLDRVFQPSLLLTSPATFSAFCHYGFFPALSCSVSIDFLLKHNVQAASFVRASLCLAGEKKVECRRRCDDDPTPQRRNKVGGHLTKVARSYVHIL